MQEAWRDFEGDEAPAGDEEETTANPFEWNRANVLHIAEHNVEPEEAEDAVSDPRRIHDDANQIAGQPRRYAIIGKTDGGRILFVVFHRTAASWAQVRVISAREADEDEKRRYRRRR